MRLFINILILLTILLTGHLPSGEASNSVAKQIKMLGFVKSRSMVQIGPPSWSRFSRYKILMLAPEGKIVEKDESVVQFEAEDGSRWEANVKNRSLKSKASLQTSMQKVTNEIKDLEGKIAEQETKVDLLEVGRVSKISDKVDTTWLLSNRDKIIQDLDIESKKIVLNLQKEKIKRKRNLLAAIEESDRKTTERFESELSVFQLAKNVTEKAPMAGVVTYLRAWRGAKSKVGSVIWRGNKVAAIVDDKNLYVECYLKEENYNSIKVGDVTQVRILGSSEVTIKGSIKSISPMAMLVSDFEANLPEKHALSDVRAFRVEVVLESVPEEAKPDGEVEVLFILES